jgi:hypothetical protein
MANLLIVVHGMGANPPGWSAAIRQKLDAVAARYAEFSGGTPFTDASRLQFGAVSYDACFAELVAQWNADADALGAFAAQSGRPLPRIVTWLRQELPHDDLATKQFFWTSAIDPVLYRSFALVRDRVRSVVMRQLVDLVNAAAADSAPAVTILAHSLGTAVVHDTLHKLAAPQRDGNEVLAAERAQFTNLFMLADVCLLGPPALRDFDYFSSIVRPAAADGSVAGYCENFFNVWHRWDPFVLAAPFRPTDWGDGYTAIGELDHVRSANVHGFAHYLDHPRVHIPLINATLGRGAVGREEARSALAEYPAIGAPECSGQIQRLKDLAREFEHVGDDLERLAIELAGFLAAAQAAAEACRGLADDLPVA